jgi:amino acid permease
MESDNNENNRMETVKRSLSANWKTLAHIMLIFAIVFFLVIYSIRVAPGLLADNQSEMPPLYQRLMKLLSSIMP